MRLALVVHWPELQVLNAADLGSIPGQGNRSHMPKRICLKCRRLGFDPWVGNPWKWEWLPTPVFLPRGFHGQMSLVDCCPWGHKESDTSERLTLSQCVFSFLSFLLLYFLKGKSFMEV